VHDGFTNRHSFDHKGKKITLVPLSPLEVHQDQVQLKKNRDQEPKPDEPEVIHFLNFDLYQSDFLSAFTATLSFIPLTLNITSLNRLMNSRSWVKSM
ncbi:unnamed protein product, partial [Brassica oleracea]